MKKGLLSYFNTWKFKHPNSNDFLRIMEKQSGLELDWYREYWVGSTHQINYAITSVEEVEGETKVNLEKLGRMPMPLDVVVTYTNGQQENFYIPLRIMRGEKPIAKGEKRTLLADWPWTHPIYGFSIPTSLSNIRSIEIDPSQYLADVDRANNSYSN